MKKARDPEALRTVIDERDLTYRELAVLAECSRNTPYLLVRGRATGDETAARLARVLRRSPDQLFEDAVSSNGQVSVTEEAVA